MKATAKWIALFLLIAMCCTVVFLFTQRPLDYSVVPAENLAPCVDLPDGRSPSKILSSLDLQANNLRLLHRNDNFVAACYGASFERCQESADLSPVITDYLSDDAASAIETYNEEVTKAVHALIIGDTQAVKTHLISAVRQNIQHSDANRGRHLVADRALSVALAIVRDTPCLTTDPICINLAVTLGQFLFRKQHPEAARALFDFAARSQLRDSYAQGAVLDLYYMEERRFDGSSLNVPRITFQSARLYDTAGFNIPAGVRYFFTGNAIYWNKDVLLSDDKQCLVDTMRFSFSQADRNFALAGFGENWREASVILTLGPLTRWLGSGD